MQPTRYQFEHVQQREQQQQVARDRFMLRATHDWRFAVCGNTVRKAPSVMVYGDVDRLDANFGKHIHALCYGVLLRGNRS
jgi:hypothetical protein